jgi:hypothetical protein
VEIDMEIVLVLLTILWQRVEIRRVETGRVVMGRIVMGRVVMNTCDGESCNKYNGDSDADDGIDETVERVGVETKEVEMLTML